MKALATGAVSFAAVLLCGSVAVTGWLMIEPAYDVSVRAPGGTRPAGVSGADLPESIEGTVHHTGRTPPDIRANWPGFRGPYRDGVSDDMTILAPNWPAGGPKKLWTREVGEGYAGCAVIGGRVFFQDYDSAKRREMVRCISLEDGNDIWSFAYKLRVKRYHGYTRTVPAANDDLVVTFGVKCHVTSLDSNTGELLWAKSLVHEYGSRVPQWYAGQCPLLDGENVILAPCGNVTEGEDANGQPVARGKDVLMTALNAKTGEVVWEVPNTRRWQMTHGSIARMELDDYTKMYVYAASGGVLAVGENGELLWETPDWKVPMANVPMPVPVPGNRLFLSGGYGAGCMMLQIVKEGDRYVPKELWRRPATVFGSQQQTPIHYKNHLFGIRPDQQFVCLSLRGEVVWSSGRGERYGKDGGAYLIADNKIFALDDDGVMTLMEATPKGYRKLDRAEVFPKLHSWAPMALTAGRLLARDETLLACFDVAKPQ